MQNNRVKKRHPLKHKELAPAIQEVINKVMLQGLNFDKALEQQMKKHKHWNVFNRTYLYETSSDLIRYWRLFYTTAEALDKKGIFHFRNLYAAWLVYRKKEFPFLPMFKQIDEQDVAEKLKKYSKLFKLRESYPDWLDDLGRKELGKNWEKMAVCLNRNPVQYLRVNTLKCSRPDLNEYLFSEGIEASEVEWSPDAVRLAFRRNVFRLDKFKEGWFEVQDAASQMVAEFTMAKSGMRVLDACAGNGGKALHLAALLKNKGRIIATDSKEFKLEELRRRARRAGASIIETRVNDSSKVIKRMAGQMDVVLLDVPCSGSGVLRRNPDSKWNLQAEDLKQLWQTQFDLMKQFSLCVKPGGLLVYATCSIFPSEGEKQIERFLQENPGVWKVEAEKRYDPEAYDADGFFMARLRKL